MCGDPIEQLVKDLALNLLQAVLGTLNDPNGSTRPSDRRVPVIAQSLARHGPLQPADVRQPCKLAATYLQKLGQLSERNDLWNWPATPPHLRRRDEPASQMRRFLLIIRRGPLLEQQFYEP